MQAVSDYEKGKVKVIPYEKRVKLSDLLGIPLDLLLYENEHLNDLTSQDKIIVNILKTSKNKTERKRQLNKLYSELNIDSYLRAEVIDVILSIYEREKSIKVLDINPDSDIDTKVNILALNNMAFTLSKLNNIIEGHSENEPSSTAPDTKK